MSDEPATAPAAAAAAAADAAMTGAGSSSAASSDAGDAMDQDGGAADGMPVPSARELLDRALKAKGQVKQRLADLSREHREIDQRIKSSGPMKRPREDRRGRDEEPPPDRAHKGRRTEEGSAREQKAAEAEAEAPASSAAAAAEKEGAAAPENGEGEAGSKMETEGAAEGEASAAAGGVGDGKGEERRAARAREREQRERERGGRPGPIEPGLGSDGPAGEDLPRSRPTPRTKEDAETRQRNRKMFGALMGTLKRASKDHEEAVGSTGQVAAQQQKLQLV